MDEVLTIGVYGYDPEAFRNALTVAAVDVFCDLRARRGLRGRQYAFANSRRLQRLLAEAGIAYEHFPELAPKADLRAVQHHVDRTEGATKRGRETLAPEFVAGFQDLLSRDEARSALDRIARRAVRPCLFCVEEKPAACHRSLAAAALAAREKVPIRHLLP